MNGLRVYKAAQATFKSIKALVPLLDRVLVQRFKPDTVSCLWCVKGGEITEG